MDKNFNIELRSSGDAWMGTFGVTLQALIDDLTIEGPVRAQIDTANGEMIEAEVIGITSAGFIVRRTGMNIDADSVVGFRA